MTGAVETAYAKINLALHVRRRRDDGYHEIESLFAFCADGDVLSAQTRDDGEVRLTIDGPFAAGLDGGEDNLVLRAARVLQRASGQALGADIMLTKNLPIASGIGGGSADAAATLRLLDGLWGTQMGRDALVALADPLGSDVPACVVSHTLIGTGRGEALLPMPLPDLNDMPALLVNPGVGVATGPVFAAWDGVDRGTLDAQHWREGRNDLAAPAIAITPVIADVLAALEQQPGVTLARMSGSGATCFALFEQTSVRDAAQAAIHARHPGWWTMASRLR